jgi:Bacterial protein of unknown function (DUF899)
MLPLFLLCYLYYLLCYLYSKLGELQRDGGNDPNDRDATFVLVSRAPLPKLEAYKAKKGWSVPWLSSFGSDFNYDFHVTNDEKVAPIDNLRKYDRIRGTVANAIAGGDCKQRLPHTGDGNA